MLGKQGIVPLSFIMLGSLDCMCCYVVYSLSSNFNKLYFKVMYERSAPLELFVCNNLEKLMHYLY